MKCKTIGCKNETPVHPTAKYCKECAAKNKKEATSKRNKLKSEQLRSAFGYKYF